MSPLFFKSDIHENEILSFSRQIMEILLFDRSTRQNLIWATDDYAERGDGYRNKDHITLDLITGKNGDVMKPRAEKTSHEKTLRKRNKAEVFTPSWICNAQNNLIDTAWFGYDAPFNEAFEGGWMTNQKKINFPPNKTWKDYAVDTRMEISCGEAPYLVSRYDSVTGEFIPLNNRIGIVDRKLRVISENTKTTKHWVEWALKSFKSVYAYDWQGDNILLARENLLISFWEYYYNKFNEEPNEAYLLDLAYILSWNVWQMDGVKFVVPNSCEQKAIEGLNMQLSLFDFEDEKPRECYGCKKNDPEHHIGTYCKVMDWEENKEIRFLSLLKK